MYAANATSSNSPYNTKSTLQALLKTRRQLLNERDKSTVNGGDAKLIQDSPNVDNGPIIHFSADGITNEESTSPSLRDVDPNGDFIYSQKLFHIADGNLYSIFSPLQGRSYGMKPSFLRKQKCTVQECRGRGRKVLRKGLKFHNFLPSESVTSEKGSTLPDDQWKVHSECKLREEHGTKQITVSNWFHSVKQPVEEESKPKEANPHDLFLSTNVVVEEEKRERRHYGENVRTLSSLLEGTPCAPAISEPITVSNQAIFKYPSLPITRTPSKLNSEKSGFLNNLLSSVANSKITNVSSSPKTDFNIHQRIVDCDGQKRRRKPEQTRRVVPYKKYLSLMEETEVGPLDLSVHSAAAACNQASTASHIQHENYEKPNSPVCHINNHMMPPPSATHKNATHYSLADKHDSAAEHERNNYSVTSNRKHGMPLCYSNTSRSHNPLPFQENPRVVLPSIIPNGSVVELPKQSYYAPNTLTHNSFRPDTRKESVFKYGLNMPPQLNGVDGAKYYESSKIANKPRKKSQRSVIKQKLEDTFKQNGFLVKTKQVSDGEATFCKFRQLRKYTRYYLKSWQQHLPDEVHKMWKGFLPPKTVLPPISGINTNTSEETT